MKGESKLVFGISGRAAVSQRRTEEVGRAAGGCAEGGGPGHGPLQVPENSGSIHFDGLLCMV